MMAFEQLWLLMFSPVLAFSGWTALVSGWMWFWRRRGVCA